MGCFARHWYFVEAPEPRAKETMASRRSQDLVEAAEALARAALSEAETSSLAVGRETVAGLIALKESIDQKFNTNNQKLETLGESISAELLKVTSEVQSLKHAIEKQDKFQRISFGIQNSHVGSFKYRLFSQEDSYSKNTAYGREYDSADLVKSILLSFQKGWGYDPGRCAVGIQNSGFQTRVNAEKAEEEFRISIIDQIFSLIGTKPSITKEADGRYAIYYS
jgi:hypothetical protein